MSPNGGGNFCKNSHKQFIPFENFKTEFSKALDLDLATWACYCSGELKICSTPNQDNPLMEGHEPLLCLDVWEHYLNYQNRRPDYIEAFFNVIN